MAKKAADDAQALEDAMRIRRYRSVEDALKGEFGLEPGMDRLALLPRYSREEGWVAPQMVYDLARALAAPGVAATGGNVTAEDAFNVGLNTMGANVALGAIAPEAGTVVGMARRGGRKPPKSVADVFAGVTDPAEALEIARRGGHLKVNKDGTYAGGPKAIDSPQKLGAQRRLVDQKVDYGAFNHTWYDRARDTAAMLSDDPAKQSLFARGGAAYSPQASPPVEVGAFARQHNAKVLTGEDVVPRTGSQSRNVARAYETYLDDGQLHPEKVRLGSKTGPYADAKDPTVPEESLYQTANDIWHGRVMGYGDDFSTGFGGAQHGYLTGENLLLADRAAARDAARGVTGGPPWTPRSGQAATWGAQRKAKRIEELVARHNKAQRAKKPENRVPPDMAAIEAEAEAYARQGIDDAVARNSGYLTNEARTGYGVDHLPMADDEQELIAAYTNLIRDASPRDPVLEGLGLYSTEARPTQGYFVNQAGQMETNPGWVNQVLLGTERNGTWHSSPAERAALDYAAHVGGFNRAQVAGAGSRFHPESRRVAEMDSLLLDTSRATPEQVSALEGRLAGVGAQPIDYGKGSLLVTKFDDLPAPRGTSQTDWVGRLPAPQTRIRELEAAVGPDLPSTRGNFEGVYAPTQLDTFGQQDWVGGRATTDLLKSQDAAAGQIRNLAERTDPGIADQARIYNDIDRAIAASTGKPVRTDLMFARQIMADGFEGKQGVSALRAWIQKHGTYGLPAIALTLAGLADRQQTSNPADAGGQL